MPRQEILEVEQLMGDEDAGLELTSENVEKSLDEIRSCPFPPMSAVTMIGCCMLFSDVRHLLHVAPVRLLHVLDKRS